uniref:RING-type domain-containing protein n=1 Tax=Gopherus agassizii TaxID=38772 RepID=A0A452IIQ3_9SAUR
MAAPDPVACLQKEVSCSICLDYFTDPVSIDCGHNFCRDCIRQCSKRSEAKLSCPQCRGTALKRKFRPSRELANVAEIAKRLSCARSCLNLNSCAIYWRNKSGSCWPGWERWKRRL